MPLIRLPATFCVLPLIFSLRLPVRFLLPCDLQLDTHDAGSVDAGLEHTPRGAGPMFSADMISCIFTCVFTPSTEVDLVPMCTICEINLVFVIFCVQFQLISLVLFRLMLRILVKH